MQSNQVRFLSNGGSRLFTAIISGFFLLFLGSGNFLTIPMAHAVPLVEPDATDITFDSNGTPMHGTVILPAGKGPFAAMVIVAGAGATSRDAYRAEAKAYAREGIATLIYDKRASYSRASADYQVLANDALNAMSALQKHPDIAPDRVGLWGHSQGGWIVPLAGASSEGPAFLVTVSASGHRSDRTQLWSNRGRLMHSGVNSSLIPAIGENLSRQLIAAQLFGDVTTDPKTALSLINQPLLAVFAEYDRSCPPSESMEIFAQSLEAGGHENYALRVIPGVDHNIRPSINGFKHHDNAMPPDQKAVRVVVDWIQSLPQALPQGTPTETSVIRDPAPSQLVYSKPVQPLVWYEASQLQLIATGAIILCCILQCGMIVMRWLRRQIYVPSSDGWLLTMAIFIPLIIIGTFWYLMQIIISGAQNIGPVILGRPTPWLALQTGTLITIILGINFLRRNIDTQRSGSLAWVFAQPVMIALIVFLPLAFYWGLLTL